MTAASKMLESSWICWYMLSDKWCIGDGIGGSFNMSTRFWDVLISISVADGCIIRNLLGIHYTVSVMRLWSVLSAKTKYNN